MGTWVKDALHNAVPHRPHGAMRRLGGEQKPPIQDAHDKCMIGELILGLFTICKTETLMAL